MNTALPLPFREELKAVLRDLKGESDEDLFTGKGRRLRVFLETEREEVVTRAITAAGIILDGYGGLHQALEVILDHYLEQYGKQALDRIRKHRLIDRDHARCAVPTCRRRGNLHVHHIVFRSQGGTHVFENLITLCAAHHLRGIHLGRIQVIGKAPDQLEWVLGVRPDGSGLLEVVGRTMIADDQPRAA